MKQEILRKLFSMKKEVLAMIFLSGVLLLVIAMPAGKGKQSTSGTGFYEAGLSGKGTDASAYEKQLKQELSGILGQMEGVGAVKVMLTLSGGTERNGGFYEGGSLPKVSGVLVVAEGGENPRVKQKILEAVEALFQIESHKISIVKKKP